MTADTLPPFSARNRRETAPIDDAFPDSAQIGLLHILDEGMRKNFLTDWEKVALELQRIARLPPKSYSNHATAQGQIQYLLDVLSWPQQYDFCERLYSHLASGYEYENNGELFRAEKSDAQEFFADELQRLFQEEDLAFEFRDGLVQRRGRRHTVGQVSKAETVLSEQRLEAARKHFGKALRYFRDRVKPDPENAVKEAVCAVEAAAKGLFPNAKAATLDGVVKWLTGTDSGKLPKTIGQTFIGLYAFRGGGEGVAHGGSTGGAATANIAEYVLAVAASQILLLVDLANVAEEEIPF